MIIIDNWAGFFSNFLKVIHWMVCNVNQEKIVPYFIDKGFKGITGEYIMNKNFNSNKENIWEIMFKPTCEYTIDELNNENNVFTVEFPQINNPYPINLYNKGYIYMNIQVYFANYFNEIRKIFYNEFKKLEFTEYLKNILVKESPIIDPKKTLAVMIRYPQHYHGVSSNYFDLIVQEINVHMKNYEYLYVISNIKEYNDKLKQIFGEKFLMYNKKILVNKNIDWGIEVWDYKKECIDVFCEVYWASQCSYIMGGSSNMLMGALFMNPNVEFKIFDALKNNNGA